jgi:hypothetical protein
MNNQAEYFEDLRIIKKVMEESSRFLSLSGLAGVYVGLIALAGAVVASVMILNGHFILSGEFFSNISGEELSLLKIKLVLLSAGVLILALLMGTWFSWRKSKAKGLQIWTPVSRRFLASLLVPLVTGGIMITIFYFKQEWIFIIPSMLVFYGIALVSATKFTYNDIFYLGLIEIISGLTAAVFPALGLLLWSLGFGLLHIAYGVIMYRKYEK